MNQTQITYEDRKKLYLDAVTWNKPQRVLFDMGSMTGWFQKDAGYSISEAINNYSINNKCIEHFNQNYKVDNFGNAFRFRFGVTNALRCNGDALGVSAKNIDDGNINVVIENFMDLDDFEEYKINPNKVMWEKVFFRAFPCAASMSAEQIADVVKKMHEFIAEGARSREEMREKYGYLSA